MDWNQAWVGLIIAIPSSILGYLAYRRSRKVDAISAQAGAVSETREGTAQIIAALNALLDQVQEDNVTFRDDLRRMTDRLDSCFGEREALRKELTRMQRKYGENGGG